MREAKPNIWINLKTSRRGGGERKDAGYYYPDNQR
jgi:hypothetical protein